MKFFLRVCFLVVLNFYSSFCVISEKKEISPSKNFLIGALSGFCGVIASEPSVYIKNMIQQRKNISLNPLTLYRGIFINAMGFVPSIAIQTTSNGMILKYITKIDAENSYKEIFSAFFAGGISGLIGAPRDLIVILQQNKFSVDSLLVKEGKLMDKDFFKKQISGEYSFYKVSKDFLNQYGLVNFFRGFVPVAIRNGGYATGLFVLAPKFKERIPNYSSDPILTNIIPGASAGAISAILTQPFDVIKIQMQVNIKDGNIFKAILKIYYDIDIKTKTQGGLRAFYKGIVPRTLGVAASMTAVGLSKNYLTNQI